MDTGPFPYNQIYPPAALQEASLVDNLGQLLSLPGFQRQYHCVIKKGSRYYTISCPVVNQQTVRGYCSGHRQSGTLHFATLKGSFSVKCCCFLYFFAHRFLKKTGENSNGTGSHTKMTQLGNSETLYFVFGLNECASCLGLLAVAAGMDTSRVCWAPTLGPSTPADKV